MGGLGINAYNADTSRQLGLGNLQDTQRRTDIAGYQTQANIANPQYTNPLAAGVGGAASLWQILNLFGNQG
jgi:hypothetical protein